MSKPLSTAGSVVVTFLTTLVLNAGINYWSGDKGAISVGQPLDLDGRTVVVVSIENYTNEFMQGIALELPVTVPLSSVVADSPVKLTEAAPPHPAALRLVTADQVTPRHITRLFISLPRGVTSSVPRVVNPVASGIRIRDESQLESPLKQAVITALIVASVYALFSALVLTYAAREIGAVQGNLDKLGERLEAADETMAAQRKDVQAIEVRVAKQRLLLLARISDYSKELHFWRNAVAKLMLSKGGDLKTGNDVAAAVTNALQTHGTKASPNDFEAVRVAASWLAESEKGGGAEKTENRQPGSSGHES